MGIGNTVRFDVGNGCFQQANAIFESSDASITVRAKQCADSTGSVVVIDCKMNSAAVALAARWLAADSADAVLVGEHSVVVGKRDAVFTQRAGSDLLFSSKLLFKQLAHFWEWLESEDKFTVFSAISRMFVTGMQMDCHPSVTELLPAITARSKFPASRSEADPATDTVELNFIGMWAIFGAGFALPLDAICASGVRVEIGRGGDILASRAKFMGGAYWREFFANILPVSAQFTRNGFLPAEAALNCSFA